LSGRRTYAKNQQLNLGHIEKQDVIQIAFLLLVAGNATTANMINLVSLIDSRLLTVPDLVAFNTRIITGRRDPSRKPNTAGRSQKETITCTGIR
jgi:cytochrome P450